MLNLNITIDGDTATVWVTGTEGRNERERLPVDHPAMRRLLDAITAATLVGRQERLHPNRPTGCADTARIVAYLSEHSEEAALLDAARTLVAAWLMS